MAQGNCQFFAYAIIRPNGFKMVGSTLYTVVSTMIGGVIKFVGHSGKGSRLYYTVFYINFEIC